MNSNNKHSLQIHNLMHIKFWWMHKKPVKNTYVKFCKHGNTQTMNITHTHTKLFMQKIQKMHFEVLSLPLNNKSLKQIIFNAHEILTNTQNYIW